MVETVSEIPVWVPELKCFEKNSIFDNTNVHYVFDSLFNSLDIGFAFRLKIHLAIWNLYIIFNATEPFKSSFSFK